MIEQENPLPMLAIFSTFARTAFTRGKMAARSAPTTSRRT